MIAGDGTILEQYVSRAFADLPMVVGRGADKRAKEFLKPAEKYLGGVSPRDWRALDDSAFEFPDTCPQLIRCNGGIGVTERELTTLRVWLCG